MSPQQANDVMIVQLDKGVALWLWLCPKCLARSKAEGWTVKDKREPKWPLKCDGQACKPATQTGGSAR